MRFGGFLEPRRPTLRLLRHAVVCAVNLSDYEPTLEVELRAAIWPRGDRELHGFFNIGNIEVQEGEMRKLSGS